MSKMVLLNPEEMKDRSDQLAGTIEAIAQTEKDKKDANAEFNKNLKALRDRCAELARVVRTGQEERPTGQQMTLEEVETNGTGKTTRRKEKSKQ